MLGWLPAETPGDDHEAGLNSFVRDCACTLSVVSCSLSLPPFYAQLASCLSFIRRYRANSRRPSTTSGFGCAAHRRGNAHTRYALVPFSVFGMYHQFYIVYLKMTVTCRPRTVSATLTTFSPPCECKVESSTTLVPLFLVDSSTSPATQILAETYQTMPSYRVCTTHGVAQLTEGLASKLRALLDARAREESLRNPT